MPQTIAVYIHIPFCLAKCPYCDFNSYAVAEGAGRRSAAMQEQEYCMALETELAYYAGLPELRGRVCRSIFFGGGTPSLFSAASIISLLEALKRAFPPQPDCEITIEANPGTINETLQQEKLAALRSAGINRLSIGAQSFAAEKLQTLGRWHSPADTRNSIRNSRRAGFDNFNIDLMFGVPGETAGDWRSDLQQAIALDPPHIAAYGLTIEAGTEFAVRARKGQLRIPDDDLQAAMYCDLQAVLEAAGYRQYEISNFARPGFECRHNLGYWDWREYLGFGAGAHSFLLPADASAYGLRWSNIPKPAHYIERAAARGDCSQRRETINKEQAEQEYLMCLLRTAAGIEPGDYQARFDLDFEERYSSVLEVLFDQNLLRREQNRISLSGKGYLFADSVLAEFARAD